MPLVGTRGAASASGFGAFANIGGGYWIGLLGGSPYNQANAVTVDSSGNMYVCGSTSTSISSVRSIELAKYSPTGVLSWQISLVPAGSGANWSIEGFGVTVDSSGNIYVCGRGVFGGNTQFGIVKCDSTGAILWQNYLTSNGEYARGVKLDSSGNVYVCGSAATGATRGILVKYDSSGTLQWQREYYGVVNIKFNGLAIDSSTNIYTCGTANNTIVLVKWDSSGAVLWQRSLDGATDIGSSVALDSTGNPYICGYSNSTGVNLFVVAKYDTSGTLQWQRNFGSGPGAYGQAITISPNDAVYVSGWVVDSGNFRFGIARYTTSGNLQWQRALGPLTTSAYGQGIAVYDNNSVYVCGYTDNSFSGSNDFLFAKLPANGSKTKTYLVGGASIVYKGSSQAEAAASLTAGTPTYSSATPTYITGTMANTSTASSLTSSVTQI